MNQTFKSMEEKYWRYYKEVYLEQYINPVNIADEKQKFFAAWQRGEQYDPLFQYQPLPQSVFPIVQELQVIRDYFTKYDHVLSRYYLKHIDGTLLALKQLQERETETFVQWLTQLYGIPSKQLQKQAELILDRCELAVKEKQTVTAEEVAELFAKELDKRHFEGWNIEVVQMPARMSIDQMQRRVRINESAYFSQQEIERLKVHEIDTHILRAENARKQPFLIFRYGFPDYLKTEEGLAILSEEKSGLLSDYDRKKYAMRVLAAAKASEYGFYELFLYLIKHMDPEDAFSMTLRTKRGLTDTSQKGGYTKDQVYLDGYLMLKQYSLQEVSRLYCGKIAAEDIETLQMLDELSDDIVYPMWLSYE